MDADISIDSYPSTDFGVLNGKVIKIGPMLCRQIPKNSVSNSVFLSPWNCSSSS